MATERETVELTILSSHTDSKGRNVDDELESPPDKTLVALARMSNSLAREIAFIKWLLVAILVMLITFANHTLPDGWWYSGW